MLKWLDFIADRRAFSPEGEGDGGDAGAGAGGDAGAGAEGGTGGEGDAGAGGDNDGKTGQDGAAPVGVILGGRKADDKSKTSEGEGDEDDKSKEGKEAEGDPLDAVPEDGKYDFGEMPEGMELDPTWAEAMQPALKDAGITGKQAKALAPLVAKLRADEAKAQMDAWGETLRGWTDAAEKLPEFKEIGHEAGLAIANRGLDAFGTDDLKQALANTGMSNHPELVRAFYKIGLTVKEDNTETNGGQATDTPAAIQHRLYGASGLPNKG